MKRFLVTVDPQLPVPPVRYGGTERMAALFCSELVRSGHQVRLIAGAGSRDYGGGLITHRAPNQSWLSRGFRKLWFSFLSLNAARSVDAVVNFGRSDYLAAVLRTRIPIVNRFANPVRAFDVAYLRARRRSNLSIVFISEDQKRGLYSVDAEPVVYNGVDTAFFIPPVDARSDNFLVFVGRLSRNKGVHLAIEVAKRTKHRLIIAGNVANEPGNQEYFAREVRPHFGRDCEWIGEVDDMQKKELLGKAKALLFPIQWREPFGIVMAESLACGTPVIALRHGSVPEVITSGRTGFVCDTVDEMCAAVGQLDTISRSACREEAVRRFSAEVFFQGMLEACARAGAPVGNSR